MVKPGSRFIWKVLETLMKFRDIFLSFTVLHHSNTCYSAVVPPFSPYTHILSSFILCQFKKPPSFMQICQWGQEDFWPGYQTLKPEGSINLVSSVSETEVRNLEWGDSHIFCILLAILTCEVSESKFHVLSRLTDYPSAIHLQYNWKQF